MFDAEFLLTSLIVVLIPGTGVIYTVSTGLFTGGRASVAAAFGCTLGILPHLTASILGLSVLLHMSALVFQGVKYAGAAYLLFLAWTMWRETGALQLNRQPSGQCLRQIALRGILLNILNPKLSIFFLAFLPQFIAPGSSVPLYELSMLSLVFMVMTFIVFVCYGLAANGFSRYVVNSPKLTIGLQRSFAMIFAALGIKLALTER